jgi:hypothetical protein
MAKRYGYNAAGQYIEFDDGANTDHGTYDPTYNYQPNGPAGTPLPQTAQGISPSTAGAGGGVPGYGALPHYNANKEAARLLWADSANQNQMTAAVAAPVSIDRSVEMQSRQRQMAMLAALQGQAAGGGPSVANAMSLEGKDAAIRAQMGAGGLRSGLAGGMGAHGANALSTAGARAGEQQAAWGALGNAAYGVRGADIQGDTEAARLAQQMALANAGFGQQASIANQQAQLAAVANRNAAAQQYGGIVQDNRTARLLAKGQTTTEDRGEYLDKKRYQDASDTAMLTGAQAIIGGVARSDERDKTSIKHDDGKLRSMLDALTAYEYRYKDPNIEGASPGKHVSVMAQDLEKSELGKAGVFDAEDGHKMVDYGKLMPAHLAATAMLHKRLDALEKGKR